MCRLADGRRASKLRPEQLEPRVMMAKAQQGLAHLAELWLAPSQPGLIVERPDSIQGETPRLHRLDAFLVELAGTGRIHDQSRPSLRQRPGDRAKSPLAHADPAGRITRREVRLSRQDPGTVIALALAIAIPGSPGQAGRD
jgi:hypothetical protein